ncbi:insulinase family protein [Fulvivirgaceae bacterium PWU5]|uniref:Insulinase family protein n=1 Tax=Dawidia cretensis TaxID=2782350 RepID=A0AAP2GW64_9BACT|nr:insulinase family protein [Dawidia cretensis]
MLAFLLLGHSTLAQNGKKVDEILLPIDEGVRHGTLENGFSYYVRKNDIPSSYALVYLAVKAGYLQEDDSQISLSHLLEHVALKGTKNFPKGAKYYLDEFVEGGGTAVNGQTGYDVTIFDISVPLEKKGALDLSLDIGYDLATQVVFDSDDVDIEREAVIAEAIRSSGREHREMANVVPKMLGKSFFSKRGIGTDQVETVRESKLSDLVRYYRDWYKPDLQAIFVVGNVNVDSVVTRIKNVFSNIPRRGDAQLRKKYSAFAPSKNQLIVVPDSDQKGISFKVYVKFPSQSVSSISDIKREVTIGLYNSMVLERFKEIASRPQPPFRFAHHFFQKNGVYGVNGVDVLATFLSVDSVSNLKSELISVSRELARIAKYGFSEKELVNAKDVLRKQMLKKGKSVTSKKLIDSYTKHFLYGYSMLDQAVLSDKMQDAIGTISLGEVSKQANSWLKGENFDFVVLVPDKIKEKLPNFSELKSIFEDIPLPDISEYRPVNYNEYNIVGVESSMAPSVNYRRKVNGVTEVMLNNGIKFVLKPFRPSSGRRDDNLILVHGFANAGAMQYGGNEYFSAIASFDFIRRSGLSNLNDLELSKFLEKNGIELSPYITDFSTGIKGSCDSSRIEYLVDMVCNYFNNPIKIRSAFDNWKSLMLQRIMQRNVDEVFMDTVYSCTREQELSLGYGDLEKVDFERSYAIFREQMNANKNYTFVVTGNFNEDFVDRMLVKYFGSISSVKAGTNDVGTVVVNTDMVGCMYGRDIKRVCASVDGATVHLAMSNAFEYNSSNLFRARALECILQDRITFRLREEEKGVYAVSVGIKCIKYPNPRFVFSINFKCSSEKAESLINASIQEVEKLGKNGIDADIFGRYVGEMERNTSRLLKSNSFWSELLYDRYFYNVERFTEVSNLSVSGVNLFVNQWVKPNKFVQFLMIPTENCGKL